MSQYKEEEVLLEYNIRVKETELLQIITDDMVQYLSGKMNSHNFPEFRENYYDHLRLSLPNYYFTHAQPEFSTSKQYGLQIPDKLSRNVMEHSGLVMPEIAVPPHVNFNHSNSSHSTIRKYRRNTKKTYQGSNLYTSYNSPYHNNNTTEKIDIAEIGLGPQFNTKSESSQLITKFNRLYFYLTALSKERRTFESMILSTEFKPIGKYMLSTENDVMEHFDYTRLSLSVESDMIKSLLNYIQEKCSDLTPPLIEICRDMISDFLITIEKLNSFDKTVFLQKPFNCGAFFKLENILSNLIDQSRYLSINYALLAQKLLIKESDTFVNRRSMFIGY